LDHFRFHRCRLGALLLVITAGSLHSFAVTVSCPVAQVHDISPAEQAYLVHDYDKAEKLYQDALTQKANDPELVYGLTRVLLREQKVKEADELTQKAIAQNPDSVLLMTALGEVEYRAGKPWLANAIAEKAVQKDPCFPQLRLLNAKLLRINSMYASAAKEVATAHRIDPHDPMIRLQWLEGLPLQERIAELEAYLNSPTGDDTHDLANLHLYLDHLKKLATEPHKSCRLVSNTQTTDIHFVNVMQDVNHIRGFGLEVKLNNATARLQIDTGAGGIFVSRTVAQRAGLQRFAQSKTSGVGNEGDKAAYSAYADDIHIGALEFKDCQVEVLDSRSVMETDGLIGMDTLSHFLVTIDYPMRKLTLGPLPQRPDEAAPAAPSLETANSGDNTSAAETAAPASAETPPNGTSETAKATAAAPSSHGLRDRYIAPEMKDWSHVYREGHLLLIPTSLNDKVTKLFVLDTGASTTIIFPAAAREVTKVEAADNSIQVRGVSGMVEKVYTADHIEFKFAHIIQENRNIVAFDSPNVSRNGMEISGFIGVTTLGQLTLTIDYRDGLVKFAYDPKRGYKYPGMN
jgi:predicted aspartyl protease